MYNTGATVKEDKEHRVALRSKHLTLECSRLSKFLVSSRRIELGVAGWSRGSASGARNDQAGQEMHRGKADQVSTHSAGIGESSSARGRKSDELNKPTVDKWWNSRDDLCDGPVAARLVYQGEKFDNYSLGASWERVSISLTFKDWLRYRWAAPNFTSFALDATNDQMVLYEWMESLRNNALSTPPGRMLLEAR
ncbi:hypothetical protein R1sor_012364 [Riccia sorocarpa]|uniref:Uncharacterized protein n=1 Tax=Riccia sorocarpa TaxID=122646 RepID=A0ABD3I3X4_9MARC